MRARLRIAAALRRVYTSIWRMKRAFREWKGPAILVFGSIVGGCLGLMLSKFLTDLRFLANYQESELGLGGAIAGGIFSGVIHWIIVAIEKAE